MYENALDSSFEGHVPAQITRTVPLFGGTLFTSRQPLTSEGFNVRDRLLYMLSRAHPDLDYCPPMPSLVSMMLIYLTEEEVRRPIGNQLSFYSVISFRQTFFAISAMINRTRQQRWYFSIAKTRALLYAVTFRALLKQKMPAVRC